jgi:hypothetical protein
MLSQILSVPGSFMSGFSKFFTTERIVLLVVVALLAYGIFTYSSAKTTEGMHHEEEDMEEDPMAEEEMEMEEDGFAGYAAKETAAPADLLPKDKNVSWNDASMKEGMENKEGGIMGPDLLSAGHHIGTIGQSLRNANQQLRSDPVISKQDIGPWMNSTIEADVTRIPLELGSN